MFNNIKTLSLAATLVVAGAVSANAVTYDFEAYADGTYGEGVFDGVAWNGNLAGGSTGLTVTASGGDDFAYLDAGGAGLGVCTIIDGADQCNPTSDDNVQLGETLILTFSEDVKITSILLRNATHGLFEALDFINFDGDNSGTYTVGLGGFGGVFGSLWEFTIGDPIEFYIASITVSPIPVPAAGLMLLTGLGGMFFARRRRKA